jgi:alpha-1,3/alpha-1,6-mannosyltransferase
MLSVELKISEFVTFIKSFTDAEKLTLLRKARAVLYTPSDEHFGIVPVSP